MAIRIQRPRLITGLFGLGLIVAMLAGVYFGHVGAAEAAKSQASNVQLITQEFSPQTLPTDGTTYVTLLQIPFSTSAKGTVQISSLMTFNAQSGGFGAGASLTCHLTLDTKTFATHSYSTIAGNVDTEAPVTATKKVSSGSHTLALSCTSALLGAGFDVSVMSQGTSLIIVE